MADILKFPDKPALASGQYFCTQCEGDTFRLASAGTIHCMKCGARMLNIVVAGTAE